MLRIHFLNVGHGDCTIIEHASGRITMIDINNASDLDLRAQQEVYEQLTPPLTQLLMAQIYGGRSSRPSIPAGYDIRLENPINFLKSIYPSKPIFRYIQSHPHLDHMRGLASLVSSGISIINFWDTEHTTVPDFQCDQDRADWGTYMKLRSGGAGVCAHKKYRDHCGPFWNRGPTWQDQGDGISILSPTPALVRSAQLWENTNDLSYVLRISYAGIDVILAGDAEQEAWDSMVDNYGERLKCHVLKASHHGRDSGYHQEAAKLMNPEYTVVSVGKKPECDASNKYRQYTSKEVWSTRWKGTITVTVDEHGRGRLDSTNPRGSYATA